MTFVSVPTDRMESTLTDIARKCEKVGCVCTWGIVGKEKIFDISLPTSNGITKFFRIFTSITVAQTKVRVCGSDAIRIVCFVRGKTRISPISITTRINRTAPRADTEEARVEMFLARFVKELRVAYKYCDSYNPSINLIRKVNEA